MLANTLEINAADGTKMKALLYATGENESIIIHVHGMAGNFYENSFIESIAFSCNKKGIDYLCFNNRGHDYIADCERVTTEGIESYMGGGAYEKFDDCVYDIKGVINWSLSKGYKKIYLEGHSSGANKIAYSYNRLKLSVEDNQKIKGVIFISPCDDIGIYEADVDEADRIKSRNLAQNYINEGKEDELMPMGTFFDYLLSAKTFMDCFKDSSPLDMFPYRKGDITGSDLEKIDVPILVIFGNDGEFILQDIEEIKTMYKRTKLKEVQVKVIDGAGHSYKEHEHELAELIIKWIKE